MQEVHRTVTYVKQEDTWIYEYISSDPDQHNAMVHLIRTTSKPTQPAVADCEVEDTTDVVQKVRFHSRGQGVTDPHGLWDIRLQGLSDELIIDFNCRAGSMRERQTQNFQPATGSVDAPPPPPPYHQAHHTHMTHLRKGCYEYVISEINGEVWQSKLAKGKCSLSENTWAGHDDKGWEILLNFMNSTSETQGYDAEMKPFKPPSWGRPSPLWCIHSHTLTTSSSTAKLPKKCRRRE